MRNNDNELIEMAFGETPAANFECPQKAATYRSYCELREGLKALRDVPEMQLSSDRLRDAVLNGGLKPEKTGFNWGWLVAPFAVGAVFMVAMRAPAPDAITTITEGPKAAETKVVLDWPEASPSLLADNWLGGPSAMQEISDSRPAFKAQPIARSADRRRSIMRSPEVPAKLAASSTSAAPSASLAKPELKAEPVMSEPAADIVVIETTANAEIGETQAREVGRTTNVVVGG